MVQSVLWLVRQRLEARLFLHTCQRYETENVRHAHSELEYSRRANSLAIFGRRGSSGVRRQIQAGSLCYFEVASAIGIRGIHILRVCLQALCYDEAAKSGFVRHAG